MKRTLFAAVMMVITMVLTGCGSGGGGASPSIVTDILSDQQVDGDIELVNPLDPLSGLIVTQGMSPTVQSVFAGIHPVTGGEFRAFLDFPLTGAGGVPSNAIIESAFLDIFINSIQPLTGTIPILIDLVNFQPPIPLVETDFFNASLPALATVSITIFQADFGNHVLVDVTPLMREAQRLGLLNFQIRILRDFFPGTGLIEINDTTGVNRGVLAPLLTVTYF
jgi:hypothetical protein